MKTQKKIRLLLVALLSLSGVPPAAADASDWLPLAVGNSWTYAHSYRDHRNPDRSQWTNYTAQHPRIPQFTLSVLRTEVIDGLTYFVLSDMPEYWPPVPSYFIAGKKLRWADDQLMERTADGEQSLFRFGEASYAVATPEGATQVTTREIHDSYSHDYRFIFKDGDGAEGASDSESYSPVENPDYEVRIVVFLKGFGIRACEFRIGSGDAPIFTNYQKAKQAVINGRTVTVREAREESGARASSSDATSIEGDSWGAIKQEKSK